MLTSFKSQETTANINNQDLFNKFSNLNNLKDFLPKEVEEFESTVDSCSFKISQLPKISLHIIEKLEYSLIKLQSKQNQIDFKMYCHIKAREKHSCSVTLEINMELNLMMKMMAEKPINLFLEKLTDQIKNI
jgi:hypothetical protein